MEIEFLVKGAMIGFAIAAPVGPIGVLCIRRTLAEGRAAGLVSGLGAATADATYAVIAGFGLTSISTFLVGQQQALRGLGGLFLLYLGVRYFLQRPAEGAAEAEPRGLLGGFAATFALTLANPLTILSFAAIFAGLGIASAGGDYLAAAMLVLGVFAGSALWWLVLSTGVSASRSRFTPSHLRWSNWIAGGVIFGFGAAALVSLL
jgi:threonine/homoserine/homoserine lactone efflux protein